MHRDVILKNSPFDVLFTVLVLTIFLAFTVAYFFVAPYSGFYFNPTNGEILQLFVNRNDALTLQEGDIIQQIGSVTWGQYYSNGGQSFFRSTHPGQIENVIVDRGGKKLVIPWVMPGFNRQEFANRFFNIWWLGYFFWFFGMIVQVFMRPKNKPWRLLIATNYLTGFWLVIGSLSAWRIWYSSLLLHSVTWVLLPLYIHFHWNFPKPLGQISKWVGYVFYTLSFGLAFSELLFPIYRNLYSIGFLLAIVGSIILFILHYTRQPELRRDLGLLIFAFLTALVPSIIIGLFGLSGQIPQAGPLALMSLPIMPGAYVYIVYRRQLGGLELRANRLISIYAFIILLNTILLLVIGTGLPETIQLEALFFSIIATAAITALLSILGFPAFQAFIEKRVLGITLSSRNLPETYSARIITSTTLNDLLKLLEEEVFPSLLVRQYAFVQMANPSARIMLSKNVAEDQVPKEALTELIASSGTKSLLPLSEADQPLDWVRIILPLQLGSETLGAWLLGRRDPDDLYPQAELPILQSLANQTAIALSNIMQTERLLKLYENDVDRNEKSRLQLALDLHDSVLNQLAILRLSVDEKHVSPNFQKSYDEVTGRLREIVTDLRPPMMGYGLKLAIEGLADSLMERSNDYVQVITDLQNEGEARYAENVEQHLFRIVQQACENALHHAKARQVMISGELTPQTIQLKIEDNGIGFEIGNGLELHELLASKHFGLAGIIERAAMIGARVEIDSSPKTGTQVRIAWDMQKVG